MADQIISVEIREVNDTVTPTEGAHEFDNREVNPVLLEYPLPLLLWAEQDSVVIWYHVVTVALEVVSPDPLPDGVTVTFFAPEFGTYDNHITTVAEVGPSNQRYAYIRINENGLVTPVGVYALSIRGMVSSSSDPLAVGVIYDDFPFTLTVIGDDEEVPVEPEPGHCRKRCYSDSTMTMRSIDISALASACKRDMVFAMRSGEEAIPL